ncbi:MAG: FAD-binding oxidoreductase [Woeseiaceae bacterium]|nr:FAD-binding oxidoreductase [Woeseiaceae bacterium]
MIPIDERITRRALLARGAALGGLAAAGSPGILLAQQSRASGPPAESPLGDLRERMDGAVIAPSDANYDQARQVWNGMIDKYPAAIARCTGVADVIHVIGYARDNGIPVTVRGGGHNVAGKALKDDAITIDLGSMNSVRVNPDARTARAGGGARWAAFDRETLAFDLYSTGGTVSTTGIGGLTLGGGLGWLMRKHGLACDNLVSADVVTADGRLLIASESQNTDLFWALRGGGGSFGVVTSFEFGLHRVEPIVGGFAMYPQRKLKDLLHFYRDYTAEAPNSVTTMAGVANGPPGTPVEGQSAGWIAVCHAGDSAEGERLLQPIRDFATPALGGFGPTSYSSLQRMFDAGSAAGNRQYWRSNFLTALHDDVIDIIVARAEDGLRGPGTMVLMEHLGGAIRRVGDHDTAFSNRAAEHNISILGSWPDKASDPANIRWTRSFGDAVQAYATGAGYVNYMTEDESAARIQSTYDANLERLIDVKRKYDPGNFFAVDRSIVP